MAERVVDDVLDRNDAKQRRSFRLIGQLLVVLVGAVLVSALIRLSLYLEYFGLTDDRVLALAVHSIGMMGKLFAETIESIDAAPVEAVRATGASNTLIVWFGILPPVLPQFLAFSLYRWDMNIRMAFILGIVGAGGIGFQLDQYIRLFKFHQASTAFIIILVAVTLLDWASAALREKLGSPEGVAQEPAEAQRMVGLPVTSRAYTYKVF